MMCLVTFVFGKDQFRYGLEQIVTKIYSDAI